MKRFLVICLALAVFLTAFSPLCEAASAHQAVYADTVSTLSKELGITYDVASGRTWGGNMVPQASSGFEGVASPAQTQWSQRVGTPTVTVENGGYNGGKCLRSAQNGVNYHSVGIDLASIILTTGTYCISCKYRVAGTDIEGNAFRFLLRTDRAYSFSAKNGANYYGGLKFLPQGSGWEEFSAIISVSDDDMAGTGHKWNFCMDNIHANVSYIEIDDFCVQKQNEPVTTGNVTAYTNVATDFVFASTKPYTDPYNDADIDAVFTNGEQTLTVPGFWDGNRIWRVRVALPTAGTWTYRTVCTDTANSGLHNKTGTVTVLPYTGSLEVYRRGFVTVSAGKRYFTYADGTPFFYLGDTHWGFGGETAEMVEIIAAKRASQGFTVWQSEPLGVGFHLEDGHVNSTDVGALQNYDEKMFIVADYGLTHANAALFFASTMESFIKNNGGYDDVLLGMLNNKELYDMSAQAKASLKKLCRYWVARYAAYPTMWTLAQEVDCKSRSELNNPFCLMADYFAEFDPYHRPLTAHMENTSTTNASASDFRNTPSHNWWGVQWKENYSRNITWRHPKDFWTNGQGKPAVLYEGHYCYLYTKQFGARMQGYMAYLNGMYGYGWGGQDTWCYLSTYTEEQPTSLDGVDVVTAEEKQAATWQDAVEYDSTYQMGYMRRFFEGTVQNWFDLQPRFDDSNYFKRASTAVLCFHASTEDKTKAVTYFYQFSDAALAAKPNATAANAALTGTVRKLLPSTKYNYLWFDPVSGTVQSRGTFTSDVNGEWAVGKKTAGDMVLYVFAEQADSVQLTKPNKTVFEMGKPVDLSGLTVQATMNSGTVRMLESGEYTLSGLSLSRLGRQEITVTATYNGGSAKSSFDIFLYLPGDADGDGYFTVDDVTALARNLIYCQLFNEVQTAAADRNADGALNAADLTLLARQAARIG